MQPASRFCVFERQERLFEKATCTPQNLMRDNRDGGDGVLDIAVVLKKIVTVVTH